ncbi:surface-adhesin E family protein [Nitrospira sp. KM1]|uniref:surface-adhesin E family protein n=1 Tax=Nitrospira sp. KM1 TaxID=1936990 RepID=UPI001564C587|nr:surface-adhesin E family protein [Nitrospira sp. KM1]
MLIGAVWLSSSPVFADWVKVASADSERLTIYANPETISRSGEFVTVWQLLDFKTTQLTGGKPYLSVMMETEFHCARLQSRRLQLAQFSGNMGSGQTQLANSSTQEWAAVQPNSPLHALWAFLCATPNPS